MRVGSGALRASKSHATEQLIGSCLITSTSFWPHYCLPGICRASLFYAHRHRDIAETCGSDLLHGGPHVLTSPQIAVQN